MSKQDLILLYGGRSAEREVSVLSAGSRSTIVSDLKTGPSWHTFFIPSLVLIEHPTQAFTPQAILSSNDISHSVLYFDEVFATASIIL